MLIYQVEIRAVGLSMAQINHELDVVDEILALLGGGLLGAELAADSQLVSLFLRAVGEQGVADVLEATDFSVERIVLLGAAHETYVELRGWLTPQALARKRMRECVADHGPHHLPVSQHGHPKPAGQHHYSLSAQAHPSAPSKLKGRL